MNPRAACVSVGGTASCLLSQPDARPDAPPDGAGFHSVPLTDVRIPQHS